LLNKSDDFWYNKIIQALDSVNLDEADDAYSSLETEHIRSPLLESATLLMIQAHMKQEDYILAEYFMDRYIQLFGTAKNKEYIEFLRIKDMDSLPSKSPL
jgi:outer membrane protein assembly factor BamD